MYSNLSNYFLIALIFGQVLLVSLGVIILHYYQILQGKANLIAMILIIINYFISMLLLKRLIQAEYDTHVIKKQEHDLNKSESMLQLIRSQRHDIINHLQTIYALLKSLILMKKLKRKFLNQAFLPKVRTEDWDFL